MVGMRTRRVYFNLFRQVIVFYKFSKDSMSRWGTADIAHADKENFYFIHIFRYPGRFTKPRLNAVFLEYRLQVEQVIS